MMMRILRIIAILTFICVLAVTAVSSVHPLAGCAAVAIHEMSHLIAARLEGVPIRRSVWRGGIGMQFDFSASSYLAEAVVCLSGSLSNYISAFIVYALRGIYGTMETPLFFICYSTVIGTVNLLPVAALDGGAVLRCILLQNMEQERALTICTAVSRTTVICFWLVSAVLVLRYEGGISMMTLALYLLLSM